jgi:predicted PurR-regulated permease PerM
MTNANNSSVDQSFLVSAMASFVQIGAVLILVYWCFTIVSPFVPVVLWGLIMGVALYPTHVGLSARLGGREQLSAVILVLIGLTILVVPALMLADSTIGALKSVASQIGDGTAQIPPPADNVADWPIIGDRVHEVWSAAATNLESTINQFEPQLRKAGRQALALAGHTAGSAFLFAFSIVIAGVFLTTAAGGYAAARNIASNLVGKKRGPEFTDLAILTIRSVAKGVLGVALIQTALAAVGLLVAGVPGAGVWAGLVLVLAIVQLPPLIVLGPIAIWYFSVAEPVPALIFLVYAAVVSVSDTFLKPLLLGRGVEVPMLVILIGAIGGAMAKGIIGLFLGAVILALGYELLKLWMAPDEPELDIEGPAAET